MNMAMIRRVTIVAASVGLLAGTAGVAHADTVDGCPDQAACGYVNGSETAKWWAFLDNNHISYVNWGAPSKVVNNTSMYSSQGNFVLDVELGLCIYTPDPLDEEAPHSVDTTADASHPVDAIAWGDSADSVDSTIIVDIGDCL